MQLSEEIKNKIKEEYKSWEATQYGDNTKADRDALGQFYTPAEITIQMLEMFDNLDGTILDPCCGAGGLLAAAIIAGADPTKVYGIEYDANIVSICRRRLSALGVPEVNIHRGDALDKRCYEFGPDYRYPFKPLYTQVSLWG